MTYDKNYTGSAGTTGSTTGTGTGRSYGSSPGYGSQGFGSPYGSGYESWSGRMGPAVGGNGKLLLGVVIGAAAGAAVALLLAPTSGREARQNLSRWARDASNKANDMASNVRQRFQEQAQSFTGAAAANEDRNIPEL